MRVAIVMGSDSDLPVVKPAIAMLDKLGVSWEARVMSAHRTPKAACEFAETAREQGFGVIIGAAGKAAHLAGVLAALSDQQLADRLAAFKREMAEAVAEKDRNLQDILRAE